ncbi:1600_t:CDS:2, partial [Dentiscutata erythropus]
MARNKIIRISDADDENNSLISENSRTKRSRRRSGNNDKGSICWKHFEPKIPKEGEVTKCTINGCNAEYIWRGSTTNLLRHLKTKHNITSTTATQLSLTNDKEVLSVIKFIVSSVLPFNYVDFLRSSELINQQITPSIIEKQTDKVHNRLFSQLKPKIQQAKFGMVSVSMINYDEIDERIMITYDWLTEDFEFHKILLYVEYHMESFVDFLKSDTLVDYIIQALTKWELTSLKFISCRPEDFDVFNDLNNNHLSDDMLKRKNEDIIICLNGSNEAFLIKHSLERWAKENSDTQEMINIITSIVNAIDIDAYTFRSVAKFLEDNRVQRIINDIQIVEKISYYLNLIEQPLKALINNHSNIDDNFIRENAEINYHSNIYENFIIEKAEMLNISYYHKLEFLNSIERPLKALINNHSNSEDDFIRENVEMLKSLLLDELPFSIFPELLQLFLPLKDIEVVTLRSLRDMLVEAFNILNETSQYSVMTHQYRWELKTLKSFLTFLINSYLNLHQRVGLFLDPHSKPIFINDPAVKRLVLDECQNYYSEIANISGINLNKSIQDSAHEEFEYYINRSQLFYNESDDLCKWWQKSKNIYPGLATLAVKYLPLLKLDNEEVLFENIEKFFDAYQ